MTATHAQMGAEGKAGAPTSLLVVDVATMVSVGSEVLVTWGKQGQPGSVPCVSSSAQSSVGKGNVGEATDVLL